jgi:hypothetical protein
MSMFRIHTFGWSARRDEADHDKMITEMTVYRWPLWAWLLDGLGDQICALTRHRCCNSTFGNRWFSYATISRLAWSRVELFKIEVPQDEIVRYERWRWNRTPFWVRDDDDD